MNTKINTLLNEEKYEDAIELMKKEYINLYNKMLDNKIAQWPKNDDIH